MNIGDKMIIIRGKADNVSTEQVRSFICATIIVLSYHNRVPMFPLAVRIKKKLGGNWGTCLGSEIELLSSMKPEDMFTTCVHETIHSAITFPEGQIEKCTSTLCSKIKNDVIKIADVLLHGTYKRAAYFAHTKIAYRTDGDDFYDQDENNKVGVVTKYNRK